MKQYALQRELKAGLVQGHKKAWKRLLSVPRVEALSLPIKVEHTTSEPTPI